ncbi:MAG TPA: FecR domain-containing protein [Caulobacteraceae bacterium]|nr:FecR domain-containing protein [Caulobacteraceae bacterium]
MTLPTDAAGWFARRRIAGLTRAEREAFDAWIAADSANLPAYEAVEEAWTGADALARDPRVAAMRQAAVRRNRPWRRWLAPAAAAAVVLTAGPAAWWAYDSGLISNHQFQTRAYRTGVGERTTITLPDGSRVTLNTDTVLRTEAIRGRRQLYLDRGQAFFKVAHDPARPFVVNAAGRTVTAVGTAFDVRVDPDRFEVTLVEGKVRVEAPVPERAARPAPASTPLRVQSTEMVAGTQLQAADDAGWKLEEVDARREVAWTTGQLVFVRQPLGEVVEELNRYSKTPILIDDEKLAQIPITGTFAPGDNAGFAAAVVSYRMARITRQSPDGIHLAISEGGLKKYSGPT